MPRHLHIFQVCKKPARFVALEFESEEKRPAFEIERVIWGTPGDYLLAELSLVLHARGWLLSDIALAVQASIEAAIRNS
jgi:hypothetical protein